MVKRTVLLAAGLLAFPLAKAGETWKDVTVVDTLCLSRVKADPDKHTRQCALQCVKGGYGLITADGTFLKFDAAGNDKAGAALKVTKKADHLRATVTGVKDGDIITVTSISIE